ncbi:MAG TPA: NAD-dependent epimerase/dehydratase family protein [Terriglobia bacterium]|nr:NAD-dependent epimerase/dehydratase family protein [Terriglobia bacterium]
MSRILVTGGCGFVGVNLIPALLERSHQVRVLDNLSTGRREDVETFHVDLQLGDIRNQADAARAMQGVDEVVHLAAHTRVMDSIEDPRTNFEVNALGTFNLLLAARERGVKKFVMASTGGAILGEKEPPVHEEMVARPLSPYGAGKLAGEGYLSAFHGSYGLATVALRFSNVYGPYSYLKASAVAAFYKRILQGQPLIVYGDGNQTRDFLFTEDLVAAVLLALEKAPGGEVFQIASGQETSVNKLISTMREVVSEAGFEVKHEPARRGEILRNYSDISKARKVLDYSPRTALRSGLKETWRWFQDNKEKVLNLARQKSAS